MVSKQYRNPTLFIASPIAVVMAITAGYPFLYKVFGRVEHTSHGVMVFLIVVTSLIAVVTLATFAGNVLFKLSQEESPSLPNKALDEAREDLSAVQSLRYSLAHPASQLVQDILWEARKCSDLLAYRSDLRLETKELVTFITSVRASVERYTAADKSTKQGEAVVFEHDLVALPDLLARFRILTERIEQATEQPSPRVFPLPWLVRRFPGEFVASISVPMLASALVFVIAGIISEAHHPFTFAQSHRLASARAMADIAGCPSAPSITKLVAVAGQPNAVFSRDEGDVDSQGRPIDVCRFSTKIVDNDHVQMVCPQDTVCVADEVVIGPAVEIGHGQQMIVNGSVSILFVRFESKPVDVCKVYAGKTSDSRYAIYRHFADDPICPKAKMIEV